MLSVDLNCDMGEGSGNDAVIMPFISSANISCGYHAGDLETIIKTVLLADKHGVAIGAHPSFPDRENFGRAEMQLSTPELFELVALQVEFMQELCRAADCELRHVKPHGALYNLSARDPQVADTIARAVKEIDPALVLFGLSGSCSVEVAKEHGLRVANEVFADRYYEDDASLRPRKEQDALIHDTGEAVSQVIRMVKERKLRSITGKELVIQADTVCIHGDGPHAMEFAKAIHEALKEHDIAIRALT